MKRIGLSVAAITGVISLTLAGCGNQTGSTTAAQGVPPAAPAVPEPPAAPALPEHVYWGDQHVHTGWSADAGLGGATLGPEDAVRYARGDEVKSNTGQMAKRDRPLDWVAVTDHSDGMGTINELRAGNPEMLADPTEKRWHDMMQKGGESARTAMLEAISAQATQTLPKVVMDPKWMVSAWEKTVDIMEKYNEPGKFTAFIAYEWTSNGVDGNNLHRNVIFRENGDKTRPYPPLTTFVSSDPAINGSDPESLWKWLADWEKKTGGQVLAIPHNGNLSNGQMFEEKRYNGSPLTKEWAEERARWEVLVEVFQYKGQSEAHPSLSPTDEYASFGLWDNANLNGLAKKPGQLKTEYAREALKDGLRLQGQFGVNPFKLGMAGGTDTHTGLPSGGEPSNWWGKFASNEPAPDRWNGVYRKQGKYIRKDWTLMSSGLTGVWAKWRLRFRCSSRNAP